jgi:hypothetical protein
MDHMSEIFGGLESALLKGRDSVAALAATTSRASTHTGVAGGPEGPAADLARAAIFQEAVISAVKAHLKEIKTVTQK